MESLENFDPAVLIEFLTIYGLRLLFAILALVAGLWLSKYMVKLLKRALIRSHVDKALVSFLESLSSFILKALVYITVLAMLGVEMTAFIAMLGAAGLAIGLALQGSLANFAGGILILLFKPFRVGDFIEGRGQSGTVRRIDILHTTLITTNNQKVVVPNGELANSAITNYSTEENRRVVYKIAVNHNADIKKAREVILSVINKDERLLPEPAARVVLAELSDNAATLNIHAWVHRSDYWAFYWDNLELVKEELAKAGIELPYLQREVRLLQS